MVNIGDDFFDLCIYRKGKLESIAAEITSLSPHL